MRKYVISQPLLPLYEAIHNAIHASQENDINDIKINIEILRSGRALSQEFGNINEIIITDHGIGFNDEKCLSFFQLFTQDKKAKFNSKGIGRLAFFSSFYNVEIHSIYNENGKQRERKFNLTIDSIGTDDIPKSEEVSGKQNFTVHQGAFYENCLQAFLEENPEKTQMNFTPPIVSFRGAKILLPSDYSTEWKFRCPVLAVEEV
jgi:hypothetical protein